MPDEHRIDTVEALRAVYRQPSELTRNKERPVLDDATRVFVERCRFAVVGTFDADGNADVSPRGGTSGFVRVLDNGHVALADLGGNNRLDTLQNVVATGRVALILIVPGQSETVRINGSGWVTTDPETLQRFGLPRTPKSAIVVKVDTTYVHCAKAFHRSGMWDPAVWAELADTPDGAAILSCQQVVEVDAATTRQWLDKGYEKQLAEEA
jgi:PPOX class probable FMN-dependent enzyme